MSTSRHMITIGRRLGTVSLLGILLTSCTVVGPRAIRAGRLAYNQAIVETNNQQMLMVAVHNRYQEQSNLLAVTSVTANVSVSATTGIQLGFGDSDNYSHNLIPFSLGAVYEENPTISYTPVAGQQYVRRLMSPVPLSVLAQFGGNLIDPAPIYIALVSSVNGVFNPEFLLPETEPDPRFDRFVALMTGLTQAHRLHWVEDRERSGSFSIVIDQRAPSHAAEVDELLGLLGLPAPDDRSAPLILPVSLALDGRDEGGIGIATRSVFDLLEILSAAIDVPEDDRADGAAASYPPAGLPGRELRVRRADARPEGAHVAVEYRGVWFYIDEKDQATKRFFRLLGSLLSVAIAESTANASAAPVLTVPVSR